MENYSFLDISMLIDGIEITGWMDGDDVINIARNVDTHSHLVGTDGAMAISQNADRSGTFRFRLKQTSKSNAYLGGLINAAEAGVNPIVTAQFVNVSSGDLVAGTQGYIKRPADMARGTNINGQEWEVVVESLYMLTGVNS